MTGIHASSPVSEDVILKTVTIDGTSSVRPEAGPKEIWQRSNPSANL